MKIQHPPTNAMKMAGDDMKRVIQTFSDGPKFMDDTRDPRTIARHEAIANAPADIQALRGKVSDAVLHALSKE